MKKHERIIIWSLVAAIVAMFLFACKTPQKRLDKLVRKNPHLVRIDTLIFTDSFTVMVPGIRADTAAPMSALRDTIVLRQEYLTVKVYEYRDSIFIEASTDTVYKTVVREISVPYPVIVTNQKPGWFHPEHPWTFPMMIVLGAFGVFILVRAIQRK